MQGLHVGVTRRLLMHRLMSRQHWWCNVFLCGSHHSPIKPCTASTFCINYPQVTIYPTHVKGHDKQSCQGVPSAAWTSACVAVMCV